MAPIDIKKIGTDKIHYTSLLDLQQDLALLIYKQSHSPSIRKKCFDSFADLKITDQDMLHNSLLGEKFCFEDLLFDGLYSGSSEQPVTRMKAHLQDNSGDLFGNVNNRTIKRATGFEVTLDEMVDEDTFNSALRGFGASYNLNGGAANEGTRLYLILIHVNQDDVDVSCAACAYTPPNRR